ncbi:MAG: rRNA maturation RNase YbeY [Tannerella sp.]|jgi:rRNA maturation RNase YbeY|nr:rRNA maturation RNase YbeY [Tannerella sp.]
MAVVFYTEKVKWPSFLKKRRLGSWMKEVAAGYGKQMGIVTCLLCKDEKILEVNRQFLQHDYYTDIITFDYSDGDVISGDVYISLDTVRSNSKVYGTAFSEELLRVMIHGILHLCGEHDKTTEEQSKMRLAENSALALFIEKIGGC